MNKLDRESVVAEVSSGGVWRFEVEGGFGRSCVQ